MGEISRDELLERGIQAVRAGHRINARILLRDYAAAAPEDALAWVWQAWVADSPAEAVGYLHKAVAIDPENESAWAGLRWAQAVASSSKLTRGSVIAGPAVVVAAPVAVAPMASPAPAAPALAPAAPAPAPPKASSIGDPFAAPAAKPVIPTMEAPVMAPAAASSIGQEDFFGASRPSMPAINPAALRPVAASNGNGNGKANGPGSGSPALPADIPGPAPTPVPARAKVDDHDFLGGRSPSSDGIPAVNGNGGSNGKGSAWSLGALTPGRFPDDAPPIRPSTAPSSARGEDSAPPPPPTDLAVKALFDGDDPSDASVEVDAARPSDGDLKAAGAAARGGPGDSDWSSPSLASAGRSGEHSSGGKSQGSAASLGDFENTQDFLAAVLPGDTLGLASRSGERPRFELNGANGSNSGAVSRSGDTRPTVMIVDDSPTVCRLLSLTLLQNGFQVHTAEDGVKALQALKRVKPDLILLDVVMPLLDGHKLCKLLKNHAATKHIPIIMLSSKDGFFEKTIGRLAGCNDYLSKPFEPMHVLQKVREYLPAPAAAGH